MTIIAQREETLIRVYRCPLCKKDFRAQTGPIQISCAVYHAPGSCCHYAEEVVSSEQLANAIRALEA